MIHQAIGGGTVEISVKSPIPLSLALDNIASAFARDPPRLADLPGLGGSSGQVGLVGGGPSLKNDIRSLLVFPGPLIGCGSVHDYLIQNDVIPEYHAFCDPDPVMATFVKEPHPDVCYLVASQCHPDLFDALEGYNVRMWHASLKGAADFRQEQVVPGGDYVMLRAWPIAAIMGHTDFHFFGFDCSFPEDCESQHAYTYLHGQEQPCGAEVLETGDRFMTSPGWVAQLDQFIEMIPKFSGKISVTIHGNGLAQALFKARFGPKT